MHYLSEFVGLTADDHHFETLLVFEMSVHLGLYRPDIFRLYHAHPRIGMVVADGDQHTLDGVGKVLEVLQLGFGGIYGRTHGVAAPLQTEHLLDPIKVLNVPVAEGNADNGHNDQYA